MKTQFTGMETVKFFLNKYRVKKAINASRIILPPNQLNNTQTHMHLKAFEGLDQTRGSFPRPFYLNF
jgi:hypothetical protein